MKKLLLLLIVFMVMLVSGCKEKEENEKPETNNELEVNEEYSDVTEPVDGEYNEGSDFVPEEWEDTIIDEEASQETPVVETNEKADDPIDEHSDNIGTENISSEPIENNDVIE